MSEPRLCYVSGNVAWFTTAERQWGDDWDDAPYEHNAGEPYSWRPYMAEHGVEPYELIRLVYLDGDLETPDTWHINSPYSVDQINAGAVPWLVSSRWSPRPEVSIMAGVTIPEFKDAVRRAGGLVYVEESALSSAIGSEAPDSTLPTHEKHNTAGIGTGLDERA